MQTIKYRWEIGIKTKFSYRKRHIDWEELRDAALYSLAITNNERRKEEPVHRITTTKQRKLIDFKTTEKKVQNKGTITPNHNLNSTPSNVW